MVSAHYDYKMLILFSSRVADAIRAPYVLGDTSLLYSLFEDAGLTELTITTHMGTTRFPSISSWMYTGVRGWTLADLVDDDQFELLLGDVEQALRPFVNGTGEVAFDAPAHIISGIPGDQSAVISSPSRCQESI